MYETLHFDKLEGVDFKYINSFSSLQPKIHKQSIFGSRFENCLFCIKYCLMTYSKVLTSNVTIALQKSSLQTTQKHFCPKFNVFGMKICFDKFEGADSSLLVFQNSNLKIYSQIRHFLSRF